jgi:hypothetical protein
MQFHPKEAGRASPEVRPECCRQQERYRGKHRSQLFPLDDSGAALERDRTAVRRFALQFS